MRFEVTINRSSKVLIGVSLDAFGDLLTGQRPYEVDNLKSTFISCKGDGKRKKTP